MSHEEKKHKTSDPMPWNQANFNQLAGMKSAYNPTSQRVTNYQETHEVGISKRSIVASKPQETWIIWDHLGYLYLAFCEMNILYIIISPSPETFGHFSQGMTWSF